MAVFDSAQPTNALSGRSERSHITPLAVRVVRDRAALEDLVPQWQDLVWRSAGVSAFSTPAAVLAWYRHAERRSEVHTVTVWSGNELVGVAPFSVIKTGPFALYSSAGAGYGYYGGPLLSPTPEPVSRAIADHLSELVSSGRAAVYLRRLPETSTLRTVLGCRTDITSIPMGAPEVNSVVRFDQMPDPEQYFARVARKHAVPRRSRRLAERFDNVEYVADDGALDLALDTMRDMLRRRFNTDLRMFGTTAHEALTRDLVHALSAAGHARVSCLMADGKRITVTVDLNVGPKVFWYAVAYEPDLAEFSLGHIELYEFLRRAHAAGASEVDLGSAGFAYKRRWATAESSFRTVAITATGLRGRIANNLRRAVIKLHRAGVPGLSSRGSILVL